jgi:hypothetical protein
MFFCLTTFSPGPPDVGVINSNLFGVDLLALPLFMTFVTAADHPHHAIASHDLAVPTHFFNRCSDFHELSPCVRDLANSATATVVSQVGFLHHAVVLMTHRMRLQLRHEVHRYNNENK